MIDVEHLEPHSHACLSISITTLQDGSYSLPMLMLYAAFQMLIEFVRSNGLAEVDWSGIESVRDEVIELHEWWTKERPTRRSPLEGAPITNPTDDLRMLLPLLDEDAKLAILWEDEDQKNLERLISIRQYL